MKISHKGLSVVKHFEGLFKKAYIDPVGIITIGYGHTGSVAYQGNEITNEQADDLLEQDMLESENNVKKYVSTEINQDQFDALVSFTFNVGGGALAGSTLLRKLNNGDFDSAAQEFLRWNKGTVNDKKVILNGLTRRRKSEKFLFETGQLKFFDGKGTVDPDGDHMDEDISVNLSHDIGNDAKYLATAGINISSSDEKILFDLAEKYDIQLPIERLIKLRNDKYPTSRPRYWAVVDFDLHSSNPRLFVLDVVNQNVETYLCAHGIGSEGSTDDGYANIFSNKPGSNATSLGIYRCAETYVSSKNGYSLRLDGLEETNSNARSRLIVMHGADYISKKFSNKYKRIGRSEGCPALDNKHISKVIDQLKLGSLLIHWKAP